MTPLFTENCNGSNAEDCPDNRGEGRGGGEEEGEEEGKDEGIGKGKLGSSSSGESWESESEQEQEVRLRVTLLWKQNMKLVRVTPLVLLQGGSIKQTLPVVTAPSLQNLGICRTLALNHREQNNL